MFCTDATDTYTKSCYNNEWIGDGYCDDETNNENCHYDGGDCCGSDIDKDYCEICACHTSEGTGTAELCYEEDWKEDGFCDDLNNNEACDYDGGDCCGSNVNKTHCTICACYTLERNVLNNRYCFFIWIFF